MIQQSERVPLTSFLVKWRKGGGMKIKHLTVLQAQSHIISLSPKEQSRYIDKKSEVQENKKSDVSNSQEGRI